MSRPLVVKPGARVREHIERNGMRPTQVRCIAAAAGGPEGPRAWHSCRWITGRSAEWLRNPQGLALVGASIGAWRMAAAAHDDPVAAWLLRPDLSFDRTF